MTKSPRIADSAPPAHPPADDPAAVDDADLLAASIARVEHRLRLFDELAEMALKRARALTEHGLTGKAATAEATPPDTVDQFVRLSRAMRLTVLLGARADAELRALRACKPPAGGRTIPQVRDSPRALRRMYH